jgi:hypothetical protein
LVLETAVCLHAGWKLIKNPTMSVSDFYPGQAPPCAEPCWIISSEFQQKYSVG